MMGSGEEAHGRRRSGKVEREEERTSLLFFIYFFFFSALPKQEPVHRTTIVMRLCHCYGIRRRNYMSGRGSWGRYFNRMRWERGRV